jgi:hypothetical protein
MPRLLPDNEEVWQVVHFSPSVWKRDFHGVSGFDWGEISRIMDFLDIQKNTLFITKLQKAEGLLLANIEQRRKDPAGDNT